MLSTVFALFLLYPQLVDSTERLNTPAPAEQDISPEKRGDIYMARKMYREAVDEYRSALDQSPRNARIYNKIGISFHHQMNFGEAKKYYEQASSLDEKYAQAVNNLGTVYYAERQYKKAQKTYQKALKITPSAASIHSNLGTAYFARRKYKQATESYLNALELDPLVFDSRGSAGTLLQERSVEDRAKYHYFLAKAFADAEMYDKALLYLRRSLEEGHGSRRKAWDDSAFSAMREMPAFVALVNPEALVAAANDTE